MSRLSNAVKSYKDKNGFFPTFLLSKNNVNFLEKFEYLDVAVNDQMYGVVECYEDNRIEVLCDYFDDCYEDNIIFDMTDFINTYMYSNKISASNDEERNILKYYLESSGYEVESLNGCNYFDIEEEDVYGYEYVEDKKEYTSVTNTTINDFSLSKEVYQKPTFLEINDVKYKRTDNGVMCQSGKYKQEIPESLVNFMFDADKKIAYSVDIHVGCKVIYTDILKRVLEMEK